MTPWKGKRARMKAVQQDRCRAMACYDLFPAEMVRDALRMGKAEGVRQSAERVIALADGLVGTIYHASGSWQMEAYKTAVAVIRAERYTPPAQVQANMVNRALGRGGSGRGFYSTIGP